MVIAIGAWLLLRPASPESTLLSKSKKTKDDKEENETDTRRKLTRSIVDKKISGVCGGIGEYFNIDSTIVRILWVIATLASGGFGILAYLIFIITISVSENSIEGGE
ncbi:MAG: PspC domain-containing protein [Candidatus Marinimicrobia bacterium]|nr:PspC domain-containing protein [Candidatus Neomarinimicrobiota bacterium]